MTDERPVHSGSIELYGDNYLINDIVTQATSEVAGHELRELSAVFMHPEAVRMIRVWITVNGDFDDDSFLESEDLLAIFRSNIKGRVIHSLFGEQTVGAGTRMNVKYGKNRKPDRVSGKVAYKVNHESAQVKTRLQWLIHFSSTTIEFI